MDKNRSKRLKTSNENSIQNSTSNTKLDYVLKRITKDEIINLLNQHTALLYGETIDKANEEKMIEKNQNLIKELINLNLSKEYDSKNELIDNQLVLDIDYDTKVKIINNLIMNFNYSISHPNSISVDVKMNLIQDNNKLIILLLGWPVRSIKGDKILNLNSSIDKKKIEDTKVSKDEIDKLKLDVDSLKDAVYSRSKVQFTCELGDFSNFFKSNDKFTSKKFYCQGILWHICLCVKKRKDDGKIDSLGFFLHQNHNHSNENWSISTKYTLKLLTQKAGVEDKVRDFFYKFPLDTVYTGYGTVEFIKYDDLIKEDSGLIKNNTVILQVILKSDRLIKE